MATDFLGNELEVGDEIAYMTLKYRYLHRGIITKINNKKCTIEYGEEGFKYKNMQFFNQVIKINK